MHFSALHNLALNHQKQKHAINNFQTTSSVLWFFSIPLLPPRPLSSSVLALTNAFHQIIIPNLVILLPQKFPAFKSSNVRHEFNKHFGDLKPLLEMNNRITIFQESVFLHGETFSLNIPCRFNESCFLSALNVPFFSFLCDFTSSALSCGSLFLSQDEK